MADVIYKTIFQLKRGESSAWRNLNPILAAGEPGFELDTGKLKIGNGTTSWNDLNYINSNLVNVDVDNQSIIIDGLGQLSLNGFDNAEIGQSIRKNSQGILEWYTPSAEDNEAIRKIFLGENDLLPVEENTVHIPVATNTSIGLIKGGNEINQIGLSSDGTGIINSVGVDKIIDVDGYTLILNCGTANT